MNAFVSRGLITLAVAGGIIAFGATAAQADDGTDGDGGLLSGLQGVLGVHLPVTISGNGISVGGDSSSSGASTSGGGSSAPASGGSTSGSNSVAGGTQGILGLDVPVTVTGNAISVLGDSSSSDSEFAGAGGSNADPASAGNAGTSGADGIASGTQVLGDAGVPVTVSGNAISVLGDSSSSNAMTMPGASGSGSSAPSGTTGGTDSVLGGTQVLGGVDVPVAVGGNAVSVIGDSSSSGSTVAGGSGSAGGSTTGTTTGEGGLLGGTQVLTGADVPVTVGGNAVSVIGDSTTTGTTAGGTDPTDPGQPGEVGGETTTPGTSAAVGAGGVLALTGSALQGWVLAFAMLMLAAGIAFAARTRTVRS